MCIRDRLPDGLIVRLLPDALEVKFSVLDFPGKVRNVFSLSEGHAEAFEILGASTQENAFIRWKVNSRDGSPPEVYEDPAMYESSLL